MPLLLSSVLYSLLLGFHCLSPNLKWCCSVIFAHWIKYISLLLYTFNRLALVTLFIKKSFPSHLFNFKILNLCKKWKSTYYSEHPYLPVNISSHLFYISMYTHTHTLMYIYDKCQASFGLPLKFIICRCRSS